MFMWCPRKGTASLSETILYTGKHPDETFILIYIVYVGTGADETCLCTQEQEIIIYLRNYYLHRKGCR